jgi:hypothetical protein
MKEKQSLLIGMRFYSFVCGYVHMTEEEKRNGTFVQCEGVPEVMMFRSFFLAGGGIPLQ